MLFKSPYPPTSPLSESYGLATQGLSEGPWPYQNLIFKSAFLHSCLDSFHLPSLHPTFQDLCALKQSTLLSTTAAIYMFLQTYWLYLLDFIDNLNILHTTKGPSTNPCGTLLHRFSLRRTPIHHYPVPPIISQFWIPFTSCLRSLGSYLSGPVVHAEPWLKDTILCIHQSSGLLCFGQSSTALSHFINKHHNAMNWTDDQAVNSNCFCLELYYLTTFQL